MRLLLSCSMRLLLVACVLVALSAGVRAVDVQIDPVKLQHIADRLGVSSLLEVEASARTPEAPSAGAIAATPSDLESGDFEIKCTTSCGFVRASSLMGSMTSGQGQAALDAAETLAATQKTYKQIEAALAASPGDSSLQSQLTQLQMQINEETAALQAAVGGPEPEIDLEGTAAALAKQKQQVEDLEAMLEKNPGQANIQAELDLAKADVRKLQGQLKAKQHDGEDVDDELEKLQTRLTSLKAALASKNGNDQEIQNEVEEVEKAMEAKQQESGGFMPKKECYRVCMNPHSPGTSGGARRLLSEDTAFAGDINNCIRLCVKVMRHLTYNMASRFL